MEGDCAGCPLVVFLGLLVWRQFENRSLMPRDARLCLRPGSWMARQLQVSRLLILSATSPRLGLRAPGSAAQT